VADEAVPSLARYELLAKIGSGGMATVHLGRLRTPGRFEKPVVVKTIRPHLSSEQQFIDMFADEARISALLEHPNIVDVFDVGRDNGTYFIAMEHLPGQAFKEVLKAGLRGSPLNVASSMKVVADAAEGLEAAHGLRTRDGEHLELVHRDVSPANIMVTYDGRVKLLDFGISKARGRIAHTVTQTLKGKLGYMAPEVVRHEPVDSRADIFSLGVVMWEALALRPLFRAANEGATLLKILQHDPTPPSLVRSDIPAGLDAICLRALARDPDDRYQTAADMRRDILASLGANAECAAAELATYMRETFSRLREAEDKMLREFAGDWREPATEPDVRFARGSQSELSCDDAMELCSDRAQSDAAVVEVAPSVARTPPPIPLAPAVAPAPERAPSIVDAYDESSIENIYAEQGDTIDTVAAGLWWERLRVVTTATAERATTAVAKRWVRAKATLADRETRHRWLRERRAALAAVVVLLMLAAASPFLAKPPVAASSGAAGESGAGWPAGKTLSGHAGDRRPAAGQGRERGAGEVDAERGAVTSDTGLTAEAEPSSGAGAAVREPDTGLAVAAATRDYRAGRRALRRGDLPMARTRFLSAVKAAPQFAPAFRELGFVFARQGKKSSARRAFTRYLQLAPNSEDAGAIRAQLHELSARY